MRNLLWKVSAVAAAIVACTAVPAMATASHPQPQPNDTLPASTSLVDTSGAGVAPNLTVTGSPGSACYGQTDKPHPSTHVYGTVDTVARTVCPTLDYVSVDQYRSRWYGWQGWGSGEKTNWGKAQATAADECKKGDVYTYLADSYHEGQDAGYAYTSNEARFTCP